MNYITRVLAAQMESCFKQSHIEVSKQYPAGKILEINGGAACFSDHDSYLSQVVAWGFSTKRREFIPEIAEIERFYAGVNHPRVDIELCPFVGNELPVWLSQRGYTLSELNNVSVLDLQTYQPVDYSAYPLLIRAIQTTEIREWAKRAALGFAAVEGEEQFFRYACSKGVKSFAAYEGKCIIAVATLAVHGDFCDLALASTLPAYRAKGLQKKLIYARLNFAKEQGLAWAMVTTEPGTISDCNIQKTGFHCAYTRIKMSLA